MGTIASSATSVTKLAYFRPHFLVWLSFSSPKKLSEIAISAPQNALFQPFSKVSKPTKFAIHSFPVTYKPIKTRSFTTSWPQNRKRPFLARAFVKTIPNCLLNKDTYPFMPKDAKDVFAQQPRVRACQSGRQNARDRTVVSFQGFKAGERRCE